MTVKPWSRERANWKRKNASLLKFALILASDVSNSILN